MHFLYEKPYIGVCCNVPIICICITLSYCSSNTNEFLRECQGTALLEADPNRGRSRLNDRERRQAALPILVFGNDMVRRLKIIFSLNIITKGHWFIPFRLNSFIRVNFKIARMV